MAELHVHTLMVRDHRISCCDTEMVQHGMGHDAVVLDLDAERETLVGEARERAEPDAQLPSLTERVGALELRVAALEDGAYQPSEPEGDPEWPEYVRPTSKDEYYHKGDKVTFEGARYVCNKNNVVASPAENPKSWIRQD